MKLISILFLFLLISITKASESLDSQVHYLEPGSSINILIKNSRFSRPEFTIFCYEGRPKYLIHYFHTVNLQIQIDEDDYNLYEASTPEIVKLDYEDKRSIFSFNFLSNRKKNVKLNPFNQTCIGIETGLNYSIYLNLIRIDFWKVCFIMIGLFVFFTSTKLSENSLFYYISGIFLGIFASFLVLVYLASKLIPRKPMMYGVMLGGWTLGIYFAQMIWDNIHMILLTYQVYAFWYVLTTGFISFIICYRLGPPTNPRSKNIIKWGLQLLALIFIFYSSDFNEASAGIDVIVILVFYFPRRLVTKFRGIWYRRFPPKTRLLSSEEYYEEGVRETTKALDDLRKYCGSPECKQWRTMMKLKNPQRFASFMEGSSHILDEEILEYEVSHQNISDDESMTEEENNDISEDEEINNSNNLRRTANNRSHEYGRNFNNKFNKNSLNGKGYLNSTPRNDSLNKSNLSTKNRTAYIEDASDDSS